MTEITEGSQEWIDYMIDHPHVCMAWADGEAENIETIISVIDALVGEE